MIMLMTYFILLALFWAAGLLIWKKIYVKTGEGDE